MRPPFEITPHAASLLAEIERLLGRHEGAMASAPSPLLRRSSRIRTIQASLQIEGNTLSEDQVTALIEGKRVTAPERDLREVRNAIECYDAMSGWNPWSAKHFLIAHGIMMKGLVNRPGHWRTRGVGIAKGNVISHIAPPADRVSGLVGSLLDWAKRDTEVPVPIRAAVCHYELEFIHPFEDGNGRMGRLWHSLILVRYHELFTRIPVESVVRDRQADYYAVLGQCDKAGNSTAFIDFALEVTLAAFSGLEKQRTPRMGQEERLEMARRHFQRRMFSRKNYLDLFPSLSAPTASRDLQLAVRQGLLSREGDKALATYRFIPSKG